MDRAMELIAKFSWLDFEQRYSMAFTTTRAERCRTRHGANGAVYLASSFATSTRRRYSKAWTTAISAAGEITPLVFVLNEVLSVLTRQYSPPMPLRASAVMTGLASLRLWASINVVDIKTRRVYRLDAATLLKRCGVAARLRHAIPLRVDL
ncbi:hypothetical protein SDRG_03597 [Saprolegnia diclina VS20]|uniref:Uncharacterized protein n=1 Tax=Saprolegnia diclina (strain VS20) TaxID=1156394 RepID=T0QZA1_SAPDV|nr:hypothetical protein SDRG_03597 [Saprolegnia diclina VS20]EQC39395.1 hypothetical protein SDRG_03597 [Saprolegnia diclina VS20]|eukprot:XP_008607456.1 hypothetical protein SDRG_03597 [Saprolegnia diclina VS20]